MKNVMFLRGRRGGQRPLRKGHGAVATALVTASGVAAALSFAPPAQAATREFNVMLTKAPHIIKSVTLWDYTNKKEFKSIGCYQVQAGKNKDVRYKIREGHYMVADMNSDQDCSTYWGYKTSPKVSNRSGLTNFWFDLSVT